MLDGDLLLDTALTDACRQASDGDWTHLLRVGLHRQVYLLRRPDGSGILLMDAVDLGVWAWRWPTYNEAGFLLMRLQVVLGADGWDTDMERGPRVPAATRG